MAQDTSNDMSWAFVIPGTQDVSASRAPALVSLIPDPNRNLRRRRHRCICGLLFFCPCLRGRFVVVVVVYL
jgi:hypothetical protein